MEGEHARVVHDLAASGAQLRRDPDGPQRRADEGHPARGAGALRGRAAGAGTAGPPVAVEAADRRNRMHVTPTATRSRQTASAGSPTWRSALTFAARDRRRRVRISDSGLGCGPEGAGTEGWPLCGGRVVPLVDTNMIIEYSHRVLATALAIAIGLLAPRAPAALPRAIAGSCASATAAFGLVLFQAALGGLTVEKGLKEELVAAHLGVAMLQIGLLILIAYMARSGGRRAASARIARAPRPRRGAARPDDRGHDAVLATIVAGGYMSASELHGTTGAAGPDVHTACGTDFPSCGGEFMPFGRSRELDIHLTHRALMYVASALVLALFAAVLRQRRRARPDARRRRLDCHRAGAGGRRCCWAPSTSGSASTSG